MTKITLTIRIKVALAGLVAANIVLAAPGDINPFFGVNGKATVAPSGAEFMVAQGLSMDAHGRIALAMRVGGSASDLQAVAVLLPNGTIDTSFGSATPGFAPVMEDGEFLSGIGVDTSGRILVSGHGDKGITIERLLENGVLDPNFGKVGKAVVPLPAGFSNFAAGPRVNVDSSGNIYVAGEVFDSSFRARMTLTKLLPDGSAARFGANGTAVVTQGVFATEQNVGTDVDFDQTGAALISGFSLAPDGTILGSVIKLKSNGTVDTTFGAGQGYVQIDAFPTSVHAAHLTELWSLAIDPQGRIVLAGNAGVSAPTQKQAVFVTRLLPDGSRDTSFTPFIGEGYSAAQASSALIDTSGKIIATGASDASLLVYRLNQNGRLDTSFANGSGEQIISDDLFPGYGAVTREGSRGNIVVSGMSASEPSIVTYELLGN